MTPMVGLGAVFALFVAIYLVVALLYPERLS